MRATYAIALLVLTIACEAKPPDQGLATAIANGLAAACPAGADPSDEKARNDCADKLTMAASTGASRTGIRAS